MTRHPKKPNVLPVAIYARVSTQDQKCEMQLTELNEICKRSNWQVLEYVETASGKAGSKRPQLEKLMADARLKKFAAVIVWKLDRFGRSVQELVARIQELDRLGVRFIAPTQGIDTDQHSPTSRLMLHILAAVAEFERDLIRERTAAGLADHKRAVEKGLLGKSVHTRSGKDLPAGRPRACFDRQKVRLLRSQGLSLRQIARKVGGSRSSIARALEMAS